VSLGNTTFVVMESVSDARFDFMKFVLTKIHFLTVKYAQYLDKNKFP
jgi:hypothetical protein